MKKLALLSIMTLYIGTLNAENKPNAYQGFFIQNKGQWPNEVLYLTEFNGANAWITRNGVVLDFFKYEPSLTTTKDERKTTSDDLKRIGHVVRMQHLFCDDNKISDIPKEKLSTYYNYFLGNDSSKWASRVGLYKEVCVNNLYPGINVRWYFDQNQLRYDYILNKGADYKQIQFQLNGADNVKVEGKDLFFKTSLGWIKQAELNVYQIINGAKKTIQSAWTINNNTITFKLGSYSSQHPVVIDPIIYCSYLGSNGTDFSRYLKKVSDGVLVGGITYSKQFPVTTGAYQGPYNYGNDRNITITKFNNAGGVDFSTHIGGTLDEEICGLEIDNNNRITFAGTTYSVNYPTTTNAYMTSSGGNSEAYATKLSSDGTQLYSSTFLGKFKNDYANGLALDASGNFIIVGYTESNNFPVTAGAVDNTFTGGTEGYIAKISSNGHNLIFFTYLGGSGHDGINSVKIDSQNNICVAGSTMSNNFPISSNAYDNTFNPFSGSGFPPKDAFVTVLNHNVTQLLYSTYIGGDNSEENVKLALDANNNVYITGLTYSNNFPTTAPGNFAQLRGSSDIFVAKLSSNLDSLYYGMYVGGGTNSQHSEQIQSITVSPQGEAIIVGAINYTSNFPFTSNAEDNSITGAIYEDGLIVFVNPSGNSLNYASLWGLDNGPEIFFDCWFDASVGQLHLVGHSSTNNLPTTSNAYNNTHNGGTDIFYLIQEIPGYANPSAIHSDNKFVDNQSVAYFYSGSVIVKSNTDDVLNIYDLTGKLIFKDNILKGENTIPLTLTNGVYVVNLHNQGVSIKVPVYK